MGKTDQINKAQMRESHGMKRGSLPSGLVHPGTECTQLFYPHSRHKTKLRMSAPTHQPEPLLHIMMLVCWTWSCLPNTLHNRNAPPALQYSLNTTQYHSHASYWCECSQSNLRASMARHMMPLHLLQCIRRRACKEAVDHIANAVCAPLLLLL